MTAISRKSIPVPSPGPPTCTPPIRISPRVPISQPADALRQNRPSVVRRTGTPSWRAARRAPPLAKTALPNRVRHSAHVATAVRPSHHSSETRNRPSPSCTVDPNTASAEAQPGASSRPVTRTDPASVCASACDDPCSTRNVARVTRKLGSPVLTTRTPLTTPTARATPRDASSAGHVSQPALAISSAVTSELAVARTPTERSNCPAMSSRATATAPMPSSAAASRTLATPPQVSNSGASSPKKTTTPTSPTRAGRLGRASARPASRRPRVMPTGDPSVGRRSLITGTLAAEAGGRSGRGTTAAGPPRRAGRSPVSPTHLAATRRTAVRARARGSRVEAPAYPVVGVPRPATDRPRVGNPVPHDAGRVRGHLHGPAARLPGGSQRLGHHGHPDRVHGLPVGAHVDPGDLAVGHLAVVVVGLQAQPPAQRPPSVALGLDAAVVQQHPAVVVADQTQFAGLSRADPDVAGQRDRRLVGRRLPGHRDQRRPFGLEQALEHGGERGHRTPDHHRVGVRDVRDVPRPGGRAGLQTAEIQLHGSHADTLSSDPPHRPQVSRIPPGAEQPPQLSRRTRTRCRLSC